MAISRTSAIDGRVYTRQADGTVAVHDPATGKSGRFRGNGRWIEGEIRDADPHMIDFVSLLRT
jgi:hypothetical protein